MGNGTLCCNGRHPLLINCVIPFLTCMAMTRRASDSICKPLMANTVSLIPKITLKFHEKYRIWGHPLCTANGMMCCNERHPLLFKCSISFLRHIMMIERAHDRLYNPYMVHIVSFLSQTTHNVYARYELMRTFSVWEMGLYAAMGDIHC